MKTIEITIALDGRTRVETKGFTGESCRDASRFIEEALGRRVEERLTTDFHQTQVGQATNQQHS